MNGTSNWMVPAALICGGVITAWVLIEYLVYGWRIYRERRRQSLAATDGVSQASDVELQPSVSHRESQSVASQ